MSCHRPFCRTASLAASTVAALVLLPPASPLPAHAETSQQATLSDSAKSDSARSDTSKADASKSPASQTPGATGGKVAAAVDHSHPSQQKSLTTKSIEKVKEVAKSAGDIFSRVPCLPPKGGARTMGSLPRVANKLASGEPVVIIAFGSSSTSR